MPITFASTHGSPPKNRAPQLPVSSSINNTYPPPPPSLPPPATAAYDVSPSAPPDSEISGDLDDLLRYFSDDLKELENTEGMEEEEIRGGSQQGYTTTTSVDSMSSDAPAGSDASSHRMLLPSHMGVASISSDGFADVPSNYYRSTTTSSSSGSGSGSGSDRGSTVINIYSCVVATPTTTPNPTTTTTTTGTADIAVMLLVTSRV
mmetsp:Transcript_9718/g.16259  ORF Transcript_9718/g.16259 Transcript_9718/m.16259 type:complete len:205 (+) Transcript_9718:564-1178(+)